MGTKDGDAGADIMSTGYNFAYLDEQTKRSLRRALLKAVAIPGHQVPFASREMPLPYGWGTGGVQCTAAVIGPSDVLKVIDQGCDDTTNAVSIRSFFARTTGVATTVNTTEATIIQTRHRIPEHPLRSGQIIVFQVPMPEPLRFLEPREMVTKRLHALGEYALMHVRLYEDIAQNGQVVTSYNYPVMVAGRYLMSPSPIPKFDNPKLHQSPALAIFGAGRERRVYAVPPYTDVRSLDFDDKPFTIESWTSSCELCGSTKSFLDEIVMDDKGGRMYACSDSFYCSETQKFSEAQKCPETQKCLEGQP
jgi:alpha-D-ribose 1-methylphosphonate 5-phosphate C-P lyase